MTTRVALEKEELALSPLTHTVPTQPRFPPAHAQDRREFLRGQAAPFLASWFRTSPVEDAATSTPMLSEIECSFS